jgi:hypothetical protein
MPRRRSSTVSSSSGFAAQLVARKHQTCRIRRRWPPCRGRPHRACGAQARATVRRPAAAASSSAVPLDVDINSGLHGQLTASGVRCDERDGRGRLPGGTRCVRARGRASRRVPVQLPAEDRGRPPERGSGADGAGRRSVVRGDGEARAAQDGVGSSPHRFNAFDDSARRARLLQASVRRSWRTTRGRRECPVACIVTNPSRRSTD